MIEVPCPRRWPAPVAVRRPQCETGFDVIAPIPYLLRPLHREKENSIPGVYPFMLVPALAARARARVASAPPHTTRHAATCLLCTGPAQPRPAASAAATGCGRGRRAAAGCHVRAQRPHGLAGMLRPAAGLRARGERRHERAEVEGGGEEARTAGRPPGWPPEIVICRFRYTCARHGFAELHHTWLSTAVVVQFSLFVPCATGSFV